MRHVYIRGIMSLIWIAAAIVSGVSGNIQMAALYVILSGIFLYSACITEKRQKEAKDKGGK